MVIIRSETAEDHEAVHSVNKLAFGTETEAGLVDRLRAAHPYISLVAVKDGQVVGHIFFSPVSLESENDIFRAIGLAPMAVLPDFQNQGIGSLLVRQGLKECERRGHNVVFVVGHPNYYPRFGFSPAKAQGIGCQYDVPDEVFMVAELTPGALGGRTGTVRYSPEFAEAH